MIQITRKERDRQLRRTDILRAAEHQFARKGYERATIQDIARQAQYGTGTVYLYFKDKESVYLSLIEEKIAAMIAIIKEKTAPIADARVKLEVLVNESLGYFDRNQDFFRIFASERSRLQWTIGTHSRKPACMDHLPFVTEIVRLGQQQKFLRDDYAALQVAEVLVSMISSVVFDCLRQKPGAASLGEMSEFVLDMFLEGARKR